MIRPGHPTSVFPADILNSQKKITHSRFGNLIWHILQQNTSSRRFSPNKRMYDFQGGRLYNLCIIKENIRRNVMKGKSFYQSFIHSPSSSNELPPFISMKFAVVISIAASSFSKLKTLPKKYSKKLNHYRILL